MTTTVWLLISSLLRHLKYSVHESTAIKNTQLGFSSKRPDPPPQKRDYSCSKGNEHSRNIYHAKYKRWKTVEKQTKKILKYDVKYNWNILWNILIHHSIMGKKCVNTAFMHDEQLPEYTCSVTYLVTICELIFIQSYFHFKLCQGLIVESAWPAMMLSVFEKDIQKKEA